MSRSERNGFDGPRALYLIAMLLAGYHWAREAIESFCASAR